MKAFLQARDIEFSVQRYAVEAVNLMALGLFASLIVGLILKSAGTGLGLPWLVQAGAQAQGAMGAAVGLAVAYALKAPPLVLFAAAATGLAGAAAGGPAGCFLAAAAGTEAGKLVSKTTPADMIVTPAAALLAGLAAAQFAGPLVGSAMTAAGGMIAAAVDWQPVLMGMAVAVVMGMLLTLPLSSAAVAVALSLDGTAAGAATAGGCAQMVGFAVLGFRDNGWGGVLSQALGTSMLQMPNIVKNPFIWLPPTLAGAAGGSLAAVWGMENVPYGAGMGSSGLVGQMGTLEAMGHSAGVWLMMLLLHFVLPALLTWLIALPLRRSGRIRAGDLKLGA
ncbi:PTS sugar transporter subunit IIC [Neisseria leonii]|uniref:PTS transporter subunit IIC n=1 Tax=Neisseria leonii TaxID=2995413 RepID=UPI0030CBF59A